jgi:indole-3-glycerol phosphate synthase
MSGVLKKIAAHKLAQIAARKAKLPEAELEAMAWQTPLSGYALRENLRRPTGQPIRVLSECKKASPSRGVLIPDYDPVCLAQAYWRGTASGISVLTETEFFLGDDVHLRDVARAVKLPVLRKDFTLERYQLLEARCLGASAVLLIAALHDTASLKSLCTQADELGLDVILEVHSDWELDAALEANPPILGINNRNLDTFEVSLDTTFELLGRVPEGMVVISESGIFSRDQSAELESAGVDAILVGEGVGTSSDPEGKVRELRGL